MMSSGCLALLVGQFIPPDQQESTTIQVASTGGGHNTLPPREEGHDRTR